MKENLHYYSKTQGDLESNPQEYIFNFKNNTFKFHTDSGVFSKDYIDYGTFAMLKAFIPNDIDLPILDMGAGYGPIGIVVSKLYNKKTVMCEINERAYNLILKNISENNANSIAYHSDLFEKLDNDMKFSSIITNPPIRAGKDIVFKIYKLGQIIVALLVTILIVLIIGVSKLCSNNNESNNETEYNTKYDVSMFKEISASDIETETKDKLSVVYVGRETCGWCAEFLPNLWQAQDEYNYETLYVDIAKIIDFNKIKDTADNLKGDDVLEGLVAVVSVKLPDAQFESQTKAKLGNTSVGQLVRDIVNDQLYRFFEENPAEAKIIIEKAFVKH